MAEPPPQPRALPHTPSLRVSGRPRSYSRHSRRTSPSTSASPTHRWRDHPSASPQRGGCVGGLAEPASGSQGASSSAAAIPAKAAPWRHSVASPPLPRQRAASQAPAVAFGVKWQLALVNFGAPRHEGEEVYTQNIYNVPAWVVLCCELHDSAHERILSECDEWRPAESSLHIQAPPQGFVAEGLVRRWDTCGVHGGLAVMARSQYVESLTPGTLWMKTTAKGSSRILPCKVRFREPKSTGLETYVAVCHLHNTHAKISCGSRTAFWEHLTSLCVGGVRFIGGDMNMGLWGVIPELGRRGVELHLCAVHAEWSDAERKWCWDSMGIWAVGPLPNPGTAMSIADHALTALHHPRMIDSTPKQLHKGYPKESYAYFAPDPERFVRLDMDTEFELVDSQCINHPKGVALAGDIPVRPWKPVRAHQDRFSAVYNMPVHEKEPIAEQVWRCPGPGPFTITDMMEPLPPMNEVMADCTRWDPLGHRWGRGAHWPLVLGIGHRRDRTPAQRQKRNQKQYQKRAEKSASLCVGGRHIHCLSLERGRTSQSQGKRRTRSDRRQRMERILRMVSFQCLAYRKHELRQLAGQLALAHIRLAVNEQQRDTTS